MKNRQVMNQGILYVVFAGLIAALYIALLIAFQPISFGPAQLRVAEALTVLPYFTPAAIPGLTIGCFLGNFLSGANMFDIVFGTSATLIAAIGSYCLRKHKFLVPLPPIIANTIVIPWVLRLAYGLDEAIPLLMLTVGLGEIISCGVFGMVLLFALNNHRRVIFNNTFNNKKLS